MTTLSLENFSVENICTYFIHRTYKVSLYAYLWHGLEIIIQHMIHRYVGIHHTHTLMYEYVKHGLVHSIIHIHKHCTICTGVYVCFEFYHSSTIISGLGYVNFFWYLPLVYIPHYFQEFFVSLCPFVIQDLL